MDGSAVLAKRYALAYIHSYGQELDESMLARFGELVNFLREQRRILFFLRIPTLSIETKQNGIRLLCQRFALGKSLETLVLLLIEHKRAPLLTDVLSYVIEQQERRMNYARFTVSSYPELSQDQQVHIEQYLALRIGKKIVVSYAVDKRLIAGVSLLGKEYWWESSVAYTIQSLKKQLKN